MPSANQKQLATLQLLGTASAYAGLVNSANQGVLNVTALYGANDRLLGLPVDQWAADMVSMEAAVLAELQLFITMQSQGYPTTDSNQTILIPPTTADEGLNWLCHSQKVIKVSGFANINVFAFGFVVVTTILLVTLDYGIVRILIHYHVPMGRFSPAVRFWIEDGWYQLQRAAYDAKGVGVWSHCDGEIPIVEDGALLESLGSLHGL